MEAGWFRSSVVVPALEVVVVVLEEELRFVAQESQEDLWDASMGHLLASSFLELSPILVEKVSLQQ